MLSSVLFNSKFLMMKKNKLVLFLLFFPFSNHSLLAPKIEVKGKVVTFNTVPVVNANVKVPGSKTSVKTDQDGSFICNENVKLIITAAGFNKLSFIVKKKKAKQLIANMRLLKSSEASKMAIEKGHILQISQFEKLLKERSGIKDYSRYSNLMDIIKNEFLSLRIVNRDVIIRGETSLTGSNVALFELNGTMVEQSAVESLSTSDIASIKVVKGNNAAIYGLRGGQGVISIKTKKGNSK